MGNRSVSFGKEWLGVLKGMYVCLSPWMNQLPVTARGYDDPMNAIFLPDA